MNFDKETSKMLKKERGSFWILSPLCEIEGYSSTDNFYLYKTGIFIEAIMKIKCFVPLESIKSVSVYKVLDNKFKVKIFSDIPEAREVVLIFGNCKKAENCALKISELAGVSVSETIPERISENENSDNNSRQNDADETNQNDFKQLKKERGSCLFSVIGYVDGFNGMKVSMNTVGFYATGLFIDGLLNIKAYIPREHLVLAKLNQTSATAYRIHIKTDIPNSEEIIIRVDKPKDAVKRYIELMDYLGMPLTQDEISSLNFKMQLNFEAKKEEERQKKEAEEQKRIQQQLYRIENGLESKKEKKARLDKMDVVYCPKCLSTQITAQKRGFSVGQAITFGTLAGMVGSNKIVLTCMKCGHKFKPGDK